MIPFRFNQSIIAPNGTWEGWYSSEELKAARDNEYKIEVIEGYHFNKWENIFDKYVSKLFAIKESSSGAKKAISKLLLNSLYGRLTILNLILQLYLN